MKEEALRILKSSFRKTCVNAYHAMDISRDGKLVPFLYRRDDLTRWAKEAFDRNERLFYCDPVDPGHPNGRLKPSQPRYEYRLARPLTEKEYKTLLSALEDTGEQMKDRNSELNISNIQLHPLR